MRFVSNLHSCKPKIETLPNLLYFYTRRSTAMYFGASGLMAMGLYFAFGMVAVKFFFLQAFWAIILFESVNYLEHYGLERRQNKNGTHETVKPQHSWDSPARLTNMITIKLQRHADHHAHAGKRFQTLQAYEESPQLPSGYATMIVLAFFPPIWRYVMHPRLMRFRKTQIGQVWRHGPQPIYDGCKKNEMKKAD
jgi:alkane 1-monooxygenase